jgi:hypothetical protein
MIKKISLIILIFLIPSAFAQEGIKIISSDYRSLVVEYTPRIDTSSVIIDFQKFFKLNLSGAVNYPESPGVPAVPSAIISIGVPSEFGNTIEILKSSFFELNGKVTPVAVSDIENGLPVFKYIIDSNYYTPPKEEIVTFSAYGLLRDMPVQNLEINPVQFDPYTSRIKIYSNILFRINFSSQQQVSQNPVKDDFIENTVLNYSVSKDWIKRENRLSKSVFNSVLSTGKWYRFEAPEEGIYRINRNQLPSYGIDPNSVDPRTIKIYNNGGKPMKESTFAPVPMDLLENSILVVGEEDGKMDEGDYILFYGRGINFWEYDSLKRKQIRNANPYSKENFFWITSGGEPGKRMARKNSSDAAPGIIQTSTKAFKHLDEDKINLVRSGRVFLGDEFNESVKSRSYMNKLDFRVPGTPVNYEFRFINSDELPVNLRIEEQQSVIYNKIIPGTNAVFERNYTTGNPLFDKGVFNGDLPENRSVLKFTFNASGFKSKGYLDIFEITYQSSLSALNDEIIFFAPDTNEVVEYHLNNFTGSTDIAVFDVTDFFDVKLITNPLMVSLSEYHFRSAELLEGGAKYIALRESRFKSPVNAVEIANSNVHATEEAKYIIITHKNFIQQAQRLKDFRETQSRYPLKSVVVDVNEIFNEFGGGLRDVTAIRNFVKYAYDNWTIRPEYVLLLGDGDYDHRNIEGFGKNFVPAYHIHHEDKDGFWRNVHHVFSYPSDDYFVRVSGDDLIIDLAVGRINNQTATDAERIVSKIIKYEAETGKGTWRNLITLLSDDAYSSQNFEGTMHVAPSEDIASVYIPSSFDIKKIYMSLFPIEHTSSGKRKPTVTKALIEAINEGTVLFNFIGHGSPSVWTHEVVFNKSSTLPLLKNDKFFFLVAATCDFGYFDNPSDQSGQELLILKENSGAIGGFSSSRPVYVNENAQLAFKFFETLLLSGRDSDQSPYSIGKVYMNIRKTKTAINDIKYHLFGDPALKLALPQYPAEISAVNGQPLNQPVQIKALERVNLEGVVKRDTFNIWEDYTGEAVLSVYDSYRRVLLNDVNFSVRLQGGLIFKGLVSVNNGRFAADFIVPKDISYEDRNGKIVLYFYNPGTDGITSTQNIFLNGTDTSTVNDGKGPVIDIFFDRPEFRSSYLVNPNSEIIVKLQDETGLNTTGTGVGHGLEGILNDRENEPIDFSSHFTGDKDAGGKSGEVRYRFSELNEGEYKILVKAWDVLIISHPGLNILLF